MYDFRYSFFLEDVWIGVIRSDIWSARNFVCKGATYSLDNKSRQVRLQFTREVRELPVAEGREKE